MKIGLINPGSKYRADPIHSDFLYTDGIINVEAALRQAGHEVRIADYAHDKAASLDSLKDCQVVGLTSMLEEYKFFEKVLPELKKRDKQA